MAIDHHRGWNHAEIHHWEPYSDGGAIVTIVWWGVRIELRTTSEVIGKMVQKEIEEIELPVALPAGSVVAYMGKEAAPPNGWQICGRGEFQDLDGKFLVGTSNVGRVGEEVGEAEHTHIVDIRSTGEVGGRQLTHPEGADNRTGAPNWFHQHQVKGELKATNSPPAVRVLFFCKQ